MSTMAAVPTANGSGGLDSESFKGGYCVEVRPHQALINLHLGWFAKGR